MHPHNQVSNGKLWNLVPCLNNRAKKTPRNPTLVLRIGIQKMSFKGPLSKGPYAYKQSFVFLKRETHTHFCLPYLEGHTRTRSGGDFWR